MTASVSPTAETVTRAQVFDPCLEDFLEMLTKLWRASVQAVVSCDTRVVRAAVRASVCSQVCATVTV